MLGRIWQAVGRVAEGFNALADSLHGLALSLGQADAEVRQRLHLDARDPSPAPPLLPGPAVPAAPPEANGVAHPPEPEAAPKGRRRAS